MQRRSPKEPDEKVIALTKAIAGQGGAVTFDVPIERSGLIREPFIEQLRAVGQAMR